MNYTMTVEQHKEYLDDLYSMCEKICRLHGTDSPQAIAMAGIYTSVFNEYQQRLEALYFLQNRGNNFKGDTNEKAK